jgi:hypothetical protein
MSPASFPIVVAPSTAFRGRVRHVTDPGLQAVYDVMLFIQFLAARPREQGVE